METKDIILELRTIKGMSQEELAEKVLVTRQAVSRWETGETVPNTETLKLLSKLFDVSINTLLGSPRQLVCECCGMPIDDSNVSHEKDGAFNEDYCKWCYADGEYTLDFFEKYKELGGKEKFEEFKRQLIHEFNTLLHVEGLPKVENLNVLSGNFINLEAQAKSAETVALYNWINTEFFSLSDDVSDYAYTANCKGINTLRRIIEYVELKEPVKVVHQLNTDREVFESFMEKTQFEKVKDFYVSCPVCGAWVGKEAYKCGFLHTNVGNCPIKLRRQAAKTSK